MSDASYSQVYPVDPIINSKIDFLPTDKIKDWSKFKGFADDSANVSK